MAAMGAVSNAPMNLSALQPGAGLVEQRSFYCIFFRTRDPQPLMGGQCNTCHIVPTCKMRSRNARAYQKKNPDKKAAGKHLSPLDPENGPVEVGKEASEQGAAEIENTNLHEDAKSATIGNTDEKVALMRSPLAENVLAKEDDWKLQDADAVAALTSQPVGGGTDQESFIDIVEELMHKVKDAERNILMLNEVRMQNLEQLEQMRRETERLHGQINVLEVQLAEAEAKLKLASQEKIKLRLLEEEIDVLKAKISENSDVQAQTSQQTAEYDKLSEHAESLQVKMKHMDEVEANLEQLHTENQALQEELRMRQSELAHAANQNALVEQLLREKKSLENLVSDLETKLAAADASLQELARLKAEKQTILEKLGNFETQISSLGTIELNTVENNVLQVKAGDLQAALSSLEAENNLLEQAQAENTVLREQIKMLEQRLVDSDAEITSQLELYQAEVESFKASLEQLKLEKDASSTVDDMPWEFWSQILLSIDGWLLEKRLLPGDATTLREMAWQRDRSIKEVFVSKRGAPDDSIISALLDLLKSNKRPGMHVVHIAAEMAPVAKVGGLGDVVTGLGKSFQRRGHLVEVILPKYDCMDYSRINNLKVLNMDLNSYFDGHTFKNKVWVGTVEGLPVYFIEPHHPANFFWRGQVYGENDDFRRFTYFSRAALEFILQSSKKPDIVHCHDWHTAAVAPMYWDLYVPQGLDSARIAFTCHNFEYQGTENPGALASCGLDPQRLHRPDRMQDDFLHNRINLLKGGIIFSNIVTTVSPTYAQEVQGPEGGKGLHIALVAHAHKFFGILNGIDNETWNPASDLLISHQYSAEEISGREHNKEALRARLLLSSIGADAKKPIVGCITRLVPQKGVHLIRHAMYRTLEQGGQFILLGSSPIPHIQREFENLSNQFHQHPHIRLILKYDESLSHSIYAGADIFIIPSIFEPCGLTQMIAMRYGAIPVARRTGGLNDSVFDVDDETIPLQRRNGFTFSVPTEEGLNSALDRALRYYVERSEWWMDLVRKVMQMDFSWNSSADQYYELYQRALARARRP